MTITPHMYAGAGLVVLTIICTWSAVTTSARNYEISNTTYRIDVSASDSEQSVVTAQQAYGAIGKATQRMQQNPFNAAREQQSQTVTLDLGFPAPPAPPIELPTPPLLPLVSPLRSGVR